jgi:hypothetical protein
MKTYILFWLKSSRGTDKKRVIAFPSKPSEDTIKDKLEQWCSSFPAWSHGDNMLNYGYKVVKMPPRRELVKRYNRACERKQKADEQWAILAAMLNPMITS